MPACPLHQKSLFRVSPAAATTCFAPGGGRCPNAAETSDFMDLHTRNDVSTAAVPSDPLLRHFGSPHNRMSETLKTQNESKAPGSSWPEVKEACMVAVYHSWLCGLSGLGLVIHWFHLPRAHSISIIYWPSWGLPHYM